MVNLIESKSKLTDFKTLTIIQFNRSSNLEIIGLKRLVCVQINHPYKKIVDIGYKRLYNIGVKIVFVITPHYCCWSLCNFRSYSYCPPSGVELVVIIHLNPRKNNVILGVKSQQ